MIILLIAIAFGVVTAIAAAQRGRSTFWWFVLGFFFAVFALIAVLLLPKVEPKVEPDPLAVAPRPRITGDVIDLSPVTDAPTASPAAAAVATTDEGHSPILSAAIGLGTVAALVGAVAFASTL